MRDLPVLAGDRVILRPLEPSRERARAHARWRNDQTIMRYHYVRPRTDASSERERIRRLVESHEDLAWDIFALAPEGPVEHVGYVILHLPTRHHHHGELAITIGERTLWGRGLGRQTLALVIEHAFTVCGLHKVFLNVAQDNERALRCYRALGFVEEGRKREHLLIDDRWVDDLILSVIDREWHARRATRRTATAPI